jgi:hypothetical protein
MVLRATCARVALMKCFTIAVLLAVTATGCAKDNPRMPTTASAHDSAAKDALKSLTVDEVDQRIAKADGKFFVFDANEKEVFEKGRVPTAKWVPFNGVTKEMLPADLGATLVFYCANEH